MNNNEETKANLWGSLAAQLEVQCGDVLSAENNKNNSGEDENEPLPLSRRASTVGGLSSSSQGNNNGHLTAAAPTGDSLNNSNNSSDWKVAAVTSSTSTSLNQYQYQSTQLFEQSHPNATASQSFGQSASTPSVPITTTTSILKDWVTSKKVEREIKDAIDSAASTPSAANGGKLDKNQKLYIVKCVKAAYLIVSKLDVTQESHNNGERGGMNSFSSGNNAAMNSNSHKDELFVPSPRDIDAAGISIIENEQSGEVVDVSFNVYRSNSFNWDVGGYNNEILMNDRSSTNGNDDRAKLGNFLGALGKLFYFMYTEGESAPTVTVDDFTPPVSTATTTSRKRKAKSHESTESPQQAKEGRKESKSKKKIREEEAIMDILLNFAIPGDSEKGDDRIIKSMRKKNLPLHLCRFVSDLLYSSLRLGKDGGVLIDENGGEKQEDSIFASISDVQSDLKQMIDYPDAFLFGTVNSRWEIVFGSNHVFGRKKEMELLINAVRRIENKHNGDLSTQQYRRMKEMVVISGHAGTGKSLLVQEIRKPLQAQGWVFLRCKYEKKVDPEPLSVIALGFDEFFASCPGSLANGGTADENQSSKDCVYRKIVNRLEELIGLTGLRTLSLLMPNLRRILKEMYPTRNLIGIGSSESKNVGLQNYQRLLIVLLDELSKLRPVLFFTDDLQFAGGTSLELLYDMITRVGTTVRGTANSGLLFIGAHRDKNPLLSKMLTQFEAIDSINTTHVALQGFELESLNEMVSEALCLPRRKTRSLAKIVHQKTLGIPLFAVEFLDDLLNQKLLIRNKTTGWEWDVDSIDLKKISSGVAALLACKLAQLPGEILSAIKILSVLGTHIDRAVLEVVKTYDGSDGSTLIPSLYAAQREGLLDIAGPTFTFMHETLKVAAFNLILAADRVPIMLRIVACLLPHCKRDEEADVFLSTTVDIINIIGCQAVSSNPGQCKVFAMLNLNAGKKSTNFRSALDYFEAGITFLQGDHWNDQYELSLSLYESAATANYSAGRHDQVAIQTNIIFSMAKSFEDKFKSYCLYINVLAIGNTDKAMDQIYHLLKSLGEDINPNTINAAMAMVDFSSLKQMLSGSRKDVLLQLPPMTDRNKLMAMKLMAMLVLYYNQQLTHMSGYFACKMIRMSIQHGHCEDTVFALSVFACTTMNILEDTQEASSLAKCVLSMTRLYSSERLIPLVYSRIYGAVLCFTQPMASALPPLLKACRISFARGTSEQSIFSTTIYVARSLQSGKKIPLLLDEVKAFALKHNQLNHMGILQLFLAPVYKFLSKLSGISFDPSSILPQLAIAPDEDIVQTALAKKESLFIRVTVVTSLAESMYLRDFAKAHEIITRYPNFFQALDNRQQLRITEFEITFLSGLFSFYWARETREPQWIQKGLNVLSAFEDWAKLNPWDCLHRYHMLKAELYHTQGDNFGATGSFDAAIANAKKNNQSQLEALACEWAALFYESIGNKEKRKQMIKRSQDAYIKWGAAKKADELKKLLEVEPAEPISMQVQNQPGMTFF